MSSNKLTTGRKLKQLMQERGISQAAVAAYLDITRQSFSRMLNKNTLNAELLQQVLDFTHIKSWEVFEQPPPTLAAQQERIIELQDEVIDLQRKLLEK